MRLRAFRLYDSWAPWLARRPYFYRVYEPRAGWVFGFAWWGFTFRKESDSYSILAAYDAARKP